MFWVLWGGRWQNEAAGTTGEELEQINSHFSRLGSCTKHMLPEGTDTKLHYIKHKNLCSMQGFKLLSGVKQFAVHEVCTKLQVHDARRNRNIAKYEQW